MKVATEPIPTRTSRADVDAVLRQARRAVSGPVVFRRNGSRAVLEPAEIAAALRSRLVGEGDRARLTLDITPDVVVEGFGDTMTAFERDPVSARVVLSGGRPHIIKGRNGFAFDLGDATQQLFEVATGDSKRTVVLRGDVREAGLTNAEARDLRITEKVSEFTTYHACCENRVSNIHRIADIVAGVVIRPGETFSLNDFVGERTRAKGFVADAAILDGEYVQAVGGGVSQFATTTYNAAYFGGYEITEHKAHSYYISRYPEGREATLSYPYVDLKITNTSPYGILIDTSYTDESITVTFWGKKWVDVSSDTGPRTNVTKGDTDFRERDNLPPGSQQVFQDPADGFDVTVTRTLRFPDGRVKSEDVFTRYSPQPRIIKRNRPGVDAG
ncbi:MAG: VanW family protein [Euzebyales bacterium]|nr:VanW family protein [Euzebyales bacterium]